jgi:hypothetical protein
MFSWRRMWWAMLYPISVWIGIVYLGEHYVVDVVLGIIYALIAYAVAMRYIAWRTAHPSAFKHHYRQGYSWGYNRTRR